MAMTALSRDRPPQDQTKDSDSGASVETSWLQPAQDGANKNHVIRTMHGRNIYMNYQYPFRTLIVIVSAIRII